jgi:lysophospholipase L1-like esterase
MDDVRSLQRHMSPTARTGIMDVLHVVERDTAVFETARATVDIVCIGDSLTGWNNFGPVGGWPYATYPDFLQELCASLGWQVPNGGIAGEISDNGPQQVRDYLELFPNARFFIIGMGTNDLGTWPDTEAASRRIVGNLGRMVQFVVERGKRPILFNVPPVNEQMFPPRIAREVHDKREHHNPRLRIFCDEHGIPLVDICSLLRDEHFGDELHPNDSGAKMIAEAVFHVLPKE